MWRIIDSGRAEGWAHMETDRAALTEILNGAATPPTLRFFQWDKPTISYGYLLNEGEVRKWASSIDHSPWTIDYVQRPTGGGVVRHSLSDLSFSLHWRRGEKIFSDNPRRCYAEIHTLCLKGLEDFFLSTPIGEGFSLQCNPTPNPSPCGEGNISRAHFSACFEEPVCNDVMLGQKKILGGALRVTRQAMLYQGTIQLPITIDVVKLKQILSDALLSSSLQPAAA